MNSGISLSKNFDPIVSYGTISYSYKLDIRDLNQSHGFRADDPSQPIILTKVDPGDSFSLTMGIGYALSYNVSINWAVNYSYYLSTSYTYKDIGTQKTSPSVISSFIFGTGWRTPSGRNISVNVRFGITDNTPDIAFTVRLPFTFKK